MKKILYVITLNVAMYFACTLSIDDIQAAKPSSFKQALISLPSKAYNKAYATGKSYFDFLELKNNVEEELKKHAADSHITPETAQSYNNLAFKLKAYSLSSLANIPLWFIHPGVAIGALIAQYAKIYSLVKQAEKLLKQNALTQEHADQIANTFEKEAQDLNAQLQQAQETQQGVQAS